MRRRPIQYSDNERPLTSVNTVPVYRIFVQPPARHSINFSTFNRRSPVRRVRRIGILTTGGRRSKSFFRRARLRRLNNETDR